MPEKLKLYWRLARLDRPVGWLLLLWPTLWALWIAADGHPRPAIVAIFVLGVITMRAAGCVINDIFDRDLDPLVERTRTRPLASGAVTVREALVIFFLLLTIAFGLVLLLNHETVLLAVVGAGIAASYPLAKRFTNLPQVYLGVAFSWGIPMAFTAQDSPLMPLAWWLLGTNLLWTVAYDTMYAMADRPDDLKAGIKSTAILFGRFDRVINTTLQILALINLVLIGAYLELNSMFYAGLAGATVTVLYQYRLCADRDRMQCFKAFLNNIWFGGFVFAGIVLAYT
ncbi:MAG: 4-hydroxybenzoate octaprenyltransferase [Acidiferrobacteraceae bacterium]|jgi:4-hydroxybenzoate polyprenyltransferase|nr:4-hydroxybenzoate octaprenyltransferase [Acidiferrobacteraceae bacterium]MCP4842485.1 4-hydroxybenzoate octaprenyltransferase [Halieaceae bacterium]HJP07361.1 4-hydroxybenzoate octaprenyltransferase [Arenicellales bacterium]|tara:strand:- start:12672 stop:13523 length:852 start_codon:yes stop_codon:yes gene_type:complete